MSITKEEILSVKGRGFLRNRGTDCFSGRVVTAAGIFSPDELRTIAECAERFGNGRVIFTARLTAEISGIPYEKIPDSEKFMAENGLAFGGTGAKVRPVTACKGTTCIYGNIDTHALAEIIFDRFYIGMRDVKLPHKFKIGIGGCPNSCMKPSLNDVGIEGCRAFAFDAALCRSCSKCTAAESCPSEAITKAAEKIIIEESKCTHCGVCVGKCPFGAIPKEADAVCRIFVGGTWGKTQRMGTRLNALYTFDEIPNVIEKVMLWYKENGYIKERLGSVIDRLGADTLEKALASSDLLDRKEEILSKPLLERS